MARPREFEEGEVLDKALHVFWDKGNDATSVQDLVKEAGLGRASLYGAFGDKEQRFKRVLPHYAERVGAEMSSLESEPSALLALERLLTSWLSVTCPKSGPRGSHENPGSYNRRVSTTSRPARGSASCRRR